MVGQSKSKHNNINILVFVIYQFPAIRLTTHMEQNEQKISITKVYSQSTIRFWASLSVCHSGDSWIALNAL